MPLMGSLYVGTSGLQTSQNALNTTAHNMTNVDTAGYTRQQVALGTRVYNTISKTACAVSWTQIGLGVNYMETRQVRDVFLDNNYRKESGRLAFYEVSNSTLKEVEDLLGESAEGESFAGSIEDLWTSIQELEKDPTNEVNLNLFITRCDEFITKANGVYESLCDYQMNMNEQIRNGVNDINKLANRLEVLNNEIVKIEAGGFEHANDLRDERNDIIDKLAKQSSISWDEDDFGYISVQIEGTDLVKGGVVNEIGLYQDEVTGFYTPYWTQNAKYTYNEEGERTLVPDSVWDCQVYDVTREISSDLNTDIGGLKSTLWARGTRPATARDMGEEGDYVAYNKIKESIMMNVEAEFDQLITSVAGKINEIIADAADPETGYLMDPTDPTKPFQIFQKIVDEPDEDFTITNLTVNQTLRQSPALLSFRKPDGSEDVATAYKLAAAFEAADYTLNPYVATKCNFRNYYSSLINQVSNSANVSGIIERSQADTVNAIDGAREQILGVNTDEELTYMIQYQNAYNASSRYINVISEMLEHLLSALG